MKTQEMVKKACWVIVLCVAGAVMLTACKSTEEHPASTKQPTKEQPTQEHPTQEHPTQEHPTSNAPAKP